MNERNLLEIAKLRICIGYFGEVHQHGWWQSSFFHSSSSAFLIPVFGKTHLLAKYHGVKEAASIVHDEHIGIGKGVYHLFRLPEINERQIHELLDKNEVIQAIEPLFQNQESAGNYLRKLQSAGGNYNGVGPVRIGSIQQMDDTSTWKLIAQYYLKAFQESIKVFPYFSEDK